MASVVIFLGIFDFSTKGMGGGIGGECDLSDDRLLEVTGGYGRFLRQAMGEHGNRASMEEIEKAVVDGSEPNTQFVDSIAQIVGLRTPKLVSMKGQACDRRATFVECSGLGFIELSQPLNDWRIPRAILVENNVDGRHESV